MHKGFFEIRLVQQCSLFSRMVFVRWISFSVKIKKGSQLYDCLFRFFLYIQLRLTQKCSLFGRIVFVRWIRFFISSCVANARIRCENQKNRDSSRFFLSLHHSHAWIHWRHCWGIFFNVCYCCFCCQDH